MSAPAPLKNKTVLITGGTRGIGRAIALRCAQDGAKVAVLARNASTQSPVVKEIEEAGGKALAIVCDIQDESEVSSAISKVAEAFGEINVLVNNATTLVLKTTVSITMDEYDLMNRINTRGTFTVVKYALPHMQKNGGHILTLCPKPQLDARWFEKNLAYSTSKFTMGLMAFGLSAEQKPFGIASNALWPFSTIDTDGLAKCGNEGFKHRPRKPSIMADAAYWIITQDPAQCTGTFYIDEIVLRTAGVVDFDTYSSVPGTKLEDLSRDHMVTEEQLKELLELRSRSGQ